MGYDIVLAADVLYGPSAFEPLLHLLGASVATGGVAIIALSHRNHGQAVPEATLRAASTSSMHPFFRRAAGNLDHDGKPKEKHCGQHLSKWRTHSVYFYANVEILEMTRM